MSDPKKTVQAPQPNAVKAHTAKPNTVAVPRSIVPSLTRGSGQPYLQVATGVSAGFVLPLEEAETAVGRDSECQLVLDEPGISRTHAVFVLGADSHVLLRDLGSTNGTYIGEEAITERRLNDGDLISLGGVVLVKFGLQSRTELELAIRLYESATRDHLTRVMNRGSFFEHLDQERAICIRQRSVFSFILLDIDHFKRVNDTYGHPAGDAILREVADVLRTSSRLEDVIGRYGGEEFAILLRATAMEPALEMAERLRQEIEKHSFQILVREDWQDLPVTISVGVASWTAPLSLEALVAAADAGLYEAKQGGRNQVRVSQPGAS